MDKQSPKITYLKDYRESAFIIESVSLTFLLDDVNTHVTNIMKIRKKNDKNIALILNGKGLILEDIILDSRILNAKEYKLTKDTLTLYDLPQRFSLEVRNTINPLSNKALNGLYKSNNIFCTQNEPEGFRHITYYLDRPDIMSFFKTKIIAPKNNNPLLLSNGNLIESKEIDDKYHYAIWEDPHAKPSYLYALVAGNLGVIKDTFTTMNNKKVDLHIYCDKGNENRCFHAMHSLKAAMRWDEKHYDREYDLDIYMIVAVDSFNFGAMENKGLNIFNSHYVLANKETATDEDFASIESVIGHEYFHNWTGNRITCRDWFQLTLKEGLTVFRDQCFSASLNDATVKRIKDVSTLRSRQFLEDDCATAHSIQPKEYLEINNFYTATIYEKGAEVIRMIETLLGVDGFKKGMDLYFKTFDEQAVTTNEFIWAMSEANKFDLTQFKRWYEQYGTPHLHVTTKYDKVNKIFKIVLEQSNKEFLPLFFPLRLALLNSSAKLEKTNAWLRNDIFIIKEKITKLTFSNVCSLPVVSINRGFSAPIKVFYKQDTKALAYMISFDDDAFNKYEALQKFAMLILKKTLYDIDKEKEIVIDTNFIKAYEKVLEDKTINSLLKAKMLELVKIDIFIQEANNIDINKLYIAYTTFFKTIAKALEVKLWKEFDFIKDCNYEINTSSMGKRALKNKILEVLSFNVNEKVKNTIKNRYKKADNMTDRFSMLKLASDISDIKPEINNDFYQTFKNDSLVMNKYLFAQATSKLPNTLEVVKKLQEDAIYDQSIPNSIRALIGAFSQNFLFFHAKNGSGYRFIAEKIIEIDSFNPNVASSLASAFKSFKKFNSSSQNFMKEEMKRILAVKTLSNNVYEIVSKILNQI